MGDGGTRGDRDQGFEADEFTAVFCLVPEDLWTVLAPCWTSVRENQSPQGKLGSKSSVYLSINIGQYIRPFHPSVLVSGRKTALLGPQDCFFFFPPAGAFRIGVVFKKVMVSRLSHWFRQANPAVSTPQDPTSEREGEGCSGLTVLFSSLKACQR